MAQKIRAVVWDLDGTLLDTLQDLTDSVNYALAAHGLPARTSDEVRRFVGDGMAKLVERAVPAGTPESVLQAATDTCRNYYAMHNQIKTAPYPGISEGLAALARQGVRMAIASNKPEPAVAALHQRFFPQTIAFSVGDIPGRPRKPAPDAPLYALQHLGVSPQEALFVGDSEMDVLTAARAGMRCLAVSWGFRSAETLRQAGAADIVATPAEAFAFIQGLHL